MQSPTYSEDPLASIERHLLAIERSLEDQSIAIAQLRDELAAAARRDDWHHVQFSEMIRIMARDLRELRATVICSAVSDGPISTQLLQLILRPRSDDQRREAINHGR